jgi:hypothetical protein
LKGRSLSCVVRSCLLFAILSGLWSAEDLFFGATRRVAEKTWQSLALANLSPLAYKK